MRPFIVDHFEHFLCGLILISRIGDIGSTYLLTPKLTLETNPIMRRLGWRFGLITMVACFIPYFSINMGVVLLVPCLMVSASNTSRIWFVRAYGEVEYRDLLYRLAIKSKLRHALAGVICSSAFTGLSGLVLLFLCPDSSRDWGYWFAQGIIIYAFIIALYGSLYMYRLFKAAKRVETLGAISA